MQSPLAHKATRPAADPPHLDLTLSHTLSLSLAKAILTSGIDSVLGQMHAADAIAFVEWLKDDATARVIEMEGDADWPQ